MCVFVRARTHTQVRPYLSAKLKQKAPMTHTRMLTQGQVNPSELHSDRRNWTMVGLRDANGCASILDGVRVASLSTGTPYARIIRVHLGPAVVFNTAVFCSKRTYT